MTSSFTPSSSLACFTNTVRCRAEYRSKRVHVKAALVRARCRFAWLAVNQHVHLQQFITHVLRQAPHTIAPVALRIVISSPLTSAGTSMVGESADGERGLLDRFDGFSG